MTVSHPHHKKTFVFRLGVTMYLLVSGLSITAQNAVDNPNLESFNVTINFGIIGSYIFPAFYEDPDGLYLPVDDLMNLFKIVRTVSSEGQVVKGFVETKDVTYEINLPQRFITFRGKKMNLAEGEAMMDMGTLYLRNNVLEKAFGFKFEFDFRSLSAKFSSEFELPVIKLKKLEKTRDRLRGTDGGIPYDTILSRDYHWFRGGMMDWSVSSSLSKQYTGETRMELGGGAEIFGGETNVFLNWSNNYGMNREQQQYSWRWADNAARVVKQVQLGRISGRSIASLLSPIDGFVFSNTPTTVRKALGDYHISDYTEPDWVVELYVNNVMIAYTKSDASGFYTFSVPIVYGTSNMVLRFYGPGGEVRSEEKKFNMPYNMLPTGELEYRVIGGALLDSANSKYGKTEVSYGVARWLTAGVGVEYLSSISVNPGIPFATFTFQPFSQLLITGEYAHKVRAKGTMNVTLPGHSNLEVAYSRYTPGQKAIIYNYLEERSGSFSLPFKVRNFSGYTKTSIRQNIYSNFQYNSGEWMVTANYRNYNLNLNNFINWTAAGSSNMYANAAFGTKIGRYLSLRPSAQYNYTTQQWISFKAELESRVFGNGYMSIRYENSFLANYNSVNLTFRYDFPFMSTYVSSGIGNKQFSATGSARGSFAYGSGNKYVHADKRGAVGRCGISITSFVDINFNGVRDEGEPSTERLKVRCSGGQVVDIDKDSTVRIVGLEPFVEYTLMLDEAGFESLAWKLPFKTVKLTTDPNQFKHISVAVQPMAEISGIVADEHGMAMGRVIILFSDMNGVLVGRVLSESDGYFTYIGFKPGDYKVEVDSLQLSILKMTSEPVIVTVHEDVQGDLVEAGMLIMKKKPISVLETEIEIPAIAEPSVEYVSADSLLRYFILFDHDKTVIRAEYVGTMKQMSAFLIGNPTFRLEIQGHTDTDGDELYNQKLSLRRADVVKRYLIASGVNAGQMNTIGLGETRPVNANRTAAEKEANRRVTFDRGTKDIVIPDQVTTDKTLTSEDTTKTERSSDTKTDVPSEQQLEVSSLTRPEIVVARKAVRDMMFVEFKDGSFVIQFGAFRSAVNARKLADRVRLVLPDKTVMIYDNGLYKVQTVHIYGVEETVRLAKEVRISEVLLLDKP